MYESGRHHGLLTYWRYKPHCPFARGRAMRSTALRAALRALLLSLARPVGSQILIILEKSIRFFRMQILSQSITLAGMKLIRKAAHMLISAGPLLFLLIPCSFLLHYTLQWDPADQFFPLRSFAADCLRSGIFPAWCPYINLGYPSAADPSLGIWYLPAFLSMKLLPFGPIVFQMEVLFHWLLAACSFGLLLRVTGCSPAVSKAGAAVFALGGVTVFHVAHYPWLISMAWGMSAIAAMLRFLKHPENEKKFAWLSGIFIALEVCGGYPFFHFILATVMTAILCYHAVKQSDGRSHFIAGLFLALSATILLSTPYLFSLYQTFPLLARSAGLSTEASSVNPVAIQDLFSLLNPAAAFIPPDQIQTDQSMRNLYGGMLLLPLLLMRLTHFKKREIFLFICGLFFLLLSCGRQLTFYEIWNRMIPLTHLFRHAGIYSVITYILWIFLFFRHIDAIKEMNFRSRLFLWLPAFIGAVVSFVLLKGEHAWIFLPVLLYAILLFKKNFSSLIPLGIAFDLGLHAIIWIPQQMNTHVSLSEWEQKYRTYPKEYPLPELKPAGSFNHWANAADAPVVHNGSLLHKTAAWDGFNSFYTSAHQQWDQWPDRWTYMEKPLLFGPDSASGHAVWNVFRPGHMEWNFNKAGKYTLQQLWHPGWQAAGAKLSRGPGGLMELETEPHASCVVMHFHDPAKKGFLLIPYLWAAAFIVLLVIWHKERQMMRVKSH